MTERGAHTHGRCVLFVLALVGLFLPSRLTALDLFEKLWARILQELRAASLVRTSPGLVEIIDPVGMSRELWSRKA